MSWSSVSLPVEFNSIVPVLSMMPLNGSIAPSLIVMSPAFSVTGVRSNTKLVAVSDAALTPFSVIDWPSPSVITALPLASSAMWAWTSPKLVKPA